MASSGDVVVMAVAAMAMAMTMSVRMAVLVVTRLVVFARSVRVARVSVCGIVTVVMVSAAVVIAGIVMGSMSRAVVAVIVAVVVIMARVVRAGVVMIRIALPGRRPQGICGWRTTLRIVEILAFEPHRGVIVFALLGGAVLA